ncbi:hypothetical protein TNCV_3588951 [Trichonephila clavipes]|nr:hypothetical protein TNCV_3588951 [Trichonephila clavipes]
MIQQLYVLTPFSNDSFLCTPLIAIHDNQRSPVIKRNGISCDNSWLSRCVEVDNLVNEYLTALLDVSKYVFAYHRDCCRSRIDHQKYTIPLAIIINRMLTAPHYKIASQRATVRGSRLSDLSFTSLNRLSTDVSVTRRMADKNASRVLTRLSVCFHILSAFSIDLYFLVWFGHSSSSTRS